MIPDVDLLQSLVSGWIAGAAAGLANTAVLLVAFSRRPHLAARIPLQRNLMVFGVVFANALLISLTLVGLLMGALQHRLGGGPGSAFSLAVFGGVVLLGLLYVFVRGTVRGGEAPVVLVTLGVTGAAFGLLLPWLAEMDA